MLRSAAFATAMAGKLYQMFTSPLVGAITRDPQLGTNPPRRVKLPGKGPRGLAVVGSKVYAAEFFSDTLAVVILPAKCPRRWAIEVAAASPVPSHGWSQAPSNSNAPQQSWKEGYTNHYSSFDLAPRKLGRGG